mmetsp:Transcript_1965/g.5061  ORF Transcript_1965/g.5061 Transcript_1965/m.5061 type:complete len:279 (-) Transcript_1965:646-1482(-)
MLRNVHKPQAGVCPELAHVRGQSAGEQGEERGFSRAVPAHDRDPAAGLKLHREVLQHRPISALVLEGRLDQLDHGVGGAGVGYSARTREDQLVLHAEVHRQHVAVPALAWSHTNLQQFLGFGLVALQLVLLEGLEVAIVVDQLCVRSEVDDVRADLVEEVGIVRDDNGGAAHLAANAHPVDKVHQPPHGLRVQVVGGLVQQQQAGLLRHGAGERQAHLPAAAQRADGLREHLLAVEADLPQRLLELRLRGLGRARVFQLRELPRLQLRLDASKDRFIA